VPDDEVRHVCEAILRERSQIEQRS
jgi:hypothetical protein